MISFLNKGSGGGSSKANIFIQNTEPETKEGIWFKKASSSYDKLITADTISSTPYFEVGPTQLYNHNESAPVAVGTDIYMFSGNGGGAYKCEKIDTVNNTATPLPDINEQGYYSWNTVYVPDLNIIRLEAGVVYKNFDLISQAVTSTGSRSTSFTGKYDVKQILPLIDNNLYYIKSNSDVNIFNFSTENIITKTGISLNFFTPYMIQPKNSNDIYCFNVRYGEQIQADSNYKYNTVTNTYQKIAPIPDAKMALRNIAELNGKIHIFGVRPAPTSISVDMTQHYIYDIGTDTWSVGTPITTTINQCSGAVTIGDTIYLTNAGDNYQSILKYREPIINFEANSVVLQNGSTYKTALLTQPANAQGRVTTSFANAYMTDSSGNLITTDEKYYGNGTSWVEIV